MSLSFRNTLQTGQGIRLALALLALHCDARPTAERLASHASSSERGVERASMAIVAEPRHDFGRALQGDTLRHAFVTRNATREELELEDTREVLGCSGTPKPRVLAPGATGKLEVTCRSRLFGPLRVSLIVTANGRAVEELALTAELEPLLTFDRALLEVNVPFGTKGSAEAGLQGARASVARLEPLSVLPKGVVVKVLPPTGGGSQRITLEVSQASAGTHAGSLRFATGLSDPKEIDLGYLIKVAGTLTVSPTNPVLDLGVAGARAIVNVTSEQPGFRVERAEVAEGPFEARLRRAGGAYVIEVTVVASKLLSGVRGANGRLIVVSNDRAEPRKAVPLFAFGSLAAAPDGGAGE